MVNRLPTSTGTDERSVAPARLLAVTVGSAFALELGIMVGLSLLPPIHPLVEAFVDATVLIIFFVPILYITTFNPLICQVAERRRAERDLYLAHQELDARVKARTAELATANEALRRERNFVDAVVETAGALVVVLDPDGRIVRFNKACERTSGYTFDEVKGHPVVPLLIPAGEVDAVTATFARLTAGDFPGEFENHWRARDGTLRCITWANTAMTAPDGTVEFVIGTGLDVTEGRLAQEALKVSEERNRSILRTARDGFWLLDLEGRFLDVNDAYCNLSGYRREELLGMSIADLDATEYADDVADHIDRVRRLGHDHFETRHRAKGGRLFDVEVSVSYLSQNGGQLFTFLRDITERKAVEAQIRASLREKEVLLKEVHHRVKNNLQIIASLLNLKAGQMSDRDAAAPLRESQNRVRTLALVHEKLYRSADLARIPFREYVRDLVDSVVASYGTDFSEPSVEVDVKDVELAVDTAIPVALIINELVSNSIKHAFDAGKAGRIAISLTQDHSGKCRLVVADNGRGIPADFDLRHSVSLGLQLVDVLATQLGGSVTVSEDGGARVEIVFDCDRGGGR